MIEVELRIESARRRVDALGYRFRQVAAHREYDGADMSAGDRSFVLLPPRQIVGTAEHGWELLRKHPSNVRLSVGVPALDATARHQRRAQSVAAAKPFAAPAAFFPPRDFEYLTLYLLGDAESLAKLESWPQLRAWLVAKDVPLRAAPAAGELPPAAEEESVKIAWLAAIETLYLTEMLPKLKAGFERTRDTDAGAVLLKLGDESVKSELVAVIRESGAKNFSKVRNLLADLLLMGDREALDLTLSWLRDPPPPMRPMRSRLLNALEIALVDPETALEVDDDRLFAAIIPALDDASLGNSIRILKHRTGFDLGFDAMAAIPSGPERARRSREIIAAWQAWYSERAAPKEER